MSILRFFGFRYAEPTPNSDYTPQQTQTVADTQTCHEARRVCKILSCRHYNLPEQNAFRQTVGNNQADYLYSRFATELGFRSVADAQRFYDANKSSKGGWW